MLPINFNCLLALGTILAWRCLAKAMALLLVVLVIGPWLGGRLRKKPVWGFADGRLALTNLIFPTFLAVVWPLCAGSIWHKLRLLLVGGSRGFEKAIRILAVEGAMRMP